MSLSGDCHEQSLYKGSYSFFFFLIGSFKMIQLTEKGKWNQNFTPKKYLLSIYLMINTNLLLASFCNKLKSKKGLFEHQIVHTKILIKK